MGSFGIAQQQQRDSDACGFTVQGESRHATVAGPDDIVPLVYVVEQPDSPIEIVSVDLQGMWLSVSNEQHTEQDCAKYRALNRSDLSLWLVASVAEEVPEHTVLRRSHLAKPSRSKLVVEVAMAEHQEIT
jgi:hypothetical protein